MARITTLKSRVPMLKQSRAPKTATQRTRGSAWMKIRDRILRRDSGLCQPCRKEGKLTLAIEVDHTTPLHHGGTDDDSNLQSICAACHAAKSAAEAQDRAAGNTPGQTGPQMR